MITDWQKFLNNLSLKTEKLYILSANRMRIKKCSFSEFKKVVHLQIAILKKKIENHFISY